MLETAGMLEDFQTFCDLYGEKQYDYSGRLLFHIIYYIQCGRKTRKERKAPLGKKLESISYKAANYLRSFSDNKDDEWFFDLCKAISGAETAAQYNEKGGGDDEWSYVKI